jgi:antirestriction protein ArdC
MSATEKAQAAAAELETAIAHLLESDDGLREYLRVSGRMHNYSWGNRLLIWAQLEQRNQPMQQVAGFNRWKDLDRPVRKGAKGILILAPSTFTVEDEATGEKRRILKGFRCVYVFAISDTGDGSIPQPPDPVALTDDSDDSRDTLARLVARSEQLGVKVDFQPAEHFEAIGHPSAGGYFNPSDPGRIVVRTDRPAADRAAIVSHELAHAIAYRLTADGSGDYADGETIAEGAAFIVMSHEGIDSSAHAVPYIAGWAKDTKRVKRALAMMAEVACQITGDCD